MNPLDALELAIKCAVSIGLVCCLPWGPPVRRLLRPYPPQPEPFAWNGPEPEQGIAREAFRMRIIRGRPSKRTVFIYGDFATEWVDESRIVSIPEGTIGLSDGYGNLTGYLERNFRDGLL